MYSMALGPRFFKWKMLSLSGTKALLYLQFLIALLTRSVVNVYLSSGPRSQQNLSIVAFCVLRYGSRCHNSVLKVQARWDLFYVGYLVLSSHLISLLVQVPRGGCVVQ